MTIYGLQEAFGAEDKTTKAMQEACKQWIALYYGSADADADPCQRIAYTVVNKLVKMVFGEYKVMARDKAVQQLLQSLDRHKRQALQLALVEGECFIKPFIRGEKFDFTLIPRSRVLVFARDAVGTPVDIGTAEKSTLGNQYYTLLERRKMDENGYLTIENKLFRSGDSSKLGVQCALGEHPDYQALPESYTYDQPVGSIGLARLKTPMLNCVDGSGDGVAVYAAAVGLIRNIDRNEAQLCGEFQRGESRIIASKDMLLDGQLTSNLFVGLDEDPERVGLTVFSPALRESSFLARKQEYLRNVESVLGLKRGLLCDVNMDERTATEIASSQGEYNLTVMDFQGMWEQALGQLVELCAILAGIYGVGYISDGEFSVDWGNGVLYDEEKTWADYQQMVKDGLLRPEFALGWRFNMPTETQEDLAAIREKFMPAQ